MTYEGKPIQVVAPGTRIRGTVVDDNTIRVTLKAAYMTHKTYLQLRRMHWNDSA